MLKTHTLFLLAILLVSCTATPTSVPTPSGVQMEQEQQAVYAAVLLHLYAAPSYVIMSNTTTSPGGVADTSPTLERIRLDLHGLDQVTADSFLSRNSVAHPVLGNMKLGSPYTLMTQQQMNQLFSPNRDGWQAFYNLYPTAPGITSLSQVGFNSSLDQALVYVGSMSHYLAGAGYYILLKKVNGAWIVDQQVMAWIS